MKASALFPALNGGELSPLLIARVDLQKFGIACRSLTNFLPLPEGPIARRPGFQHIGSTGPLANSPSWLVPFVFGRLDAWMLELNGSGMRFWRQGGLVETSPGVPYVVATSWIGSDFEAPDGTLRVSAAQARDRMWFAGGRRMPQLLQRFDVTDWTMTRFHPSDGPFQPENHDQSRTLYVHSGSNSPGDLVRLQKSGDWDEKTPAPNFNSWDNYLRIWLAPSTTTTPWEPGRSISANAIVLSDGKFYRAVNSATTGGVRPIHTRGTARDGNAGVIWEYQGSDHAILQFWGNSLDDRIDFRVVTPLPTLLFTGGAAAATARWQWHEWDYFDYPPECVGFGFGRLVFGRGNKLWFSRTDDFFSFADRTDGQVLADDALTLTLTGPKITAIHWLHETSAGLVVGTDGGEFLVTKANSAEVFGAVTDATRNAEVKQHTAFGSARVRPVMAHGKALMIDASRRRLRELELRLETGRLSGLDLSALASHILGAGVTWQAWQGAPDNTLWLGLADGSLVSCAYLPEQEIVAFARHQLAGTAAGPAVVEHGETMPADDGKSTDLWVIVRRTIQGTTRRRIERLSPPWKHGTGQGPADSRHLDSWLERDGTPVTTLWGIGHLQGEVVHGLADGFAVGPLTVSSGGSVTLPFAASKVVLGLRYRSEVALLVPDSGGIDGPGTHKLRRARRLLATLIESGDEFEAGTLATLRKVSERSAQLPLDQVPPLVSNDVRVPLDLGREYRPDVRIAAETALPFTLAAVMQRLEVAE